ncbi:MAG: PilZ domain-containing protein [Endomicrobiia bacterium]|nr:PilZ domain-containing protein [Endomicrobiia bacterium]
MVQEWRRKHARISCYIPVLIRAPSKTPQESWGVIRDVSLGGLRLETRYPLLSGDSVYATFSFSQNFSFVNTKSKIRRVAKSGVYNICGMEFESLVDVEHLHNALEEYIETQTKETL